MKTFLAQHIAALKKLVLSAAQLENIVPSDCRNISIQVFRKTSQQISETTLKRVYGFAYSKFNPSLFTLNALSKFCGYNDWEDFCEKNDNNGNHSGNVSWDYIKHNADKITGFTLQVLKNRSGIPYNLTIEREFINRHFEAFLSSGNKATVFSAPAGYGKTIALCHWVEEHMLLSAAGKSNDIILFFSSHALINVFVGGKGINEWLMSLIGYNADDDFLTLLDVKKKHDGIFYLVIDGLDEHMFKNEQFQLLIDQVLDVFSFYHAYDSFKLVLTLRSATWINYRHEFENFTSSWFTGLANADDPNVNVPLFSIDEIKELCARINPAIQNFPGIDIAGGFNHPLYFQLYYKQHKADFSLNDADHLSIYELVATFILNKIYLGNHSVEKAIIINALIEGMDFSKEKFEVDKLKVIDLIKQNEHAYNDLLGLGFLREINKSTGLEFNTVIQFGDNNFLNYSIARLLLYKNKNVFDAGVIKTINELFIDGSKVQLLKWCILYANKTHQVNNIGFIDDLKLVGEEKSELGLFLGDMHIKNPFA